jgi:GR25 family glycosyltransferase involved in LPS biosynthesis
MYNFLILISIIIITVVSSIKFKNTETFNNKEKQIHAFVINLDRNIERYNAFMKVYNMHMSTTPINRFVAVDGSKLSYDDIQKISTPEILNGIETIDKTHQRVSNEYLTRGMIGCYQSHIGLYQYALQKNYDVIMVFEDDADFNIDLMQFIHDIGELPLDWDMLLLGDVGIFKQQPYTDAWKRVYEFWGLQGYIINKKGMQKIIENAYPIKKQIDHIMSDLAQNNVLKIYSYKICLVNQAAPYSDVQMQVTQ